MSHRAILACAAVCGALALAGCAVPQAKPEPVPETHYGSLVGYLGNAVPDGVALLPPPPAPGSTLFANDEAVSRASQKLLGTPRYALAVTDANLVFPAAATSFACALGVPITQAQSPYLYQVMRRVLTDAALPTNAAKVLYRRPRPFAFHHEPLCTPEEAARMQDDGSYPSAHSAIGWAWALVLVQVAPERADALMARGRAFGQSRLVCNAHWQTDLIAARFLAAGSFALLQANATYRSDVAAASAEVAKLRAGGAAPDADCAAEAAALSMGIDGAI